jgi:hypothetical protein
MAKRPSGPPLGCYVFIVGLSGVAYALPYFLTVFFYGFPVFLVFLLLSSRWSKPPTLEEIDEAQVSSAMFDLQTKRHALVEKISAIRKSGRKQGTRYLIDKERFEARSRSGQELNQALTSATSLLSDIVAQIEIATNPSTRKIHALHLAKLTWMRGRGFRLAFFAALPGFLFTTGLLKAFVDQSRLPDFLMWNIYPQGIDPCLEWGAVVGWAFGTTMLMIAKQRYRAMHELDIRKSIHESVNLNHHPEDEPEINFTDEPDLDDDPYEVLNVSPQASVPEIKASYKAAIVKCHPDTVADRSLSIRQAAEAEAQRVNAAYAAIRTARGFN